MYEHLDLRQDGDVVWATMNRPERLNALNRKLVEELRDFFVGLYWRRDVRVVVPGGMARGARVKLVNDQPRPVSILGLFPEVEVHEG